MPAKNDPRQTLAAFKLISNTVDAMPEADFVKMINVLYSNAAQALDDYGEDLPSELIPLGFVTVILPIVVHRFTGGRITFDFINNGNTQGELVDD